MATKSKEELLAEANELGLEVTEENTVAEIKEAIAAAKATAEPEQEEVAQEEPVTDANGAGEGREPSIQEEPEQSFDERTGAGTPPWQREDGSQDNGSETE